MLLFLVLSTVLIASVDGNKVPKLIKKINKALGLPKSSKVLWDITFIANNSDEITNLKARVDQLEESCNFTKGKRFILYQKGYSSVANN